MLCAAFSPSAMFFPQFTYSIKGTTNNAIPWKAEPYSDVQSEDKTCTRCPIRGQDLPPLSNQKTRLAPAVQSEDKTCTRCPKSEDKTCTRCPIRGQDLRPLSYQKTKLAPAVQSEDKTCTRCPIGGQDSHPLTNQMLSGLPSLIRFCLNILANCSNSSRSVVSSGGISSLGVCTCTPTTL